MPDFNFMDMSFPFYTSAPEGHRARALMMVDGHRVRVGDIDDCWPIIVADGAKTVVELNRLSLLVDTAHVDALGLRLGLWRRAEPEAGLDRGHSPRGLLSQSLSLFNFTRILQAKRAYVCLFGLFLGLV